MYIVHVILPRHCQKSVALVSADTMPGIIIKPPTPPPSEPDQPVASSSRRRPENRTLKQPLTLIVADRDDDGQLRRRAVTDKQALKSSLDAKVRAERETEKWSDLLMEEHTVERAVFKRAVSTRRDVADGRLHTFNPSIIKTSCMNDIFLISARIRSVGIDRSVNTRAQRFTESRRLPRRLPSMMGTTRKVSAPRSARLGVCGLREG